MKKTLLWITSLFFAVGAIAGPVDVVGIAANVVSQHLSIALVGGAVLLGEVALAGFVWVRLVILDRQDAFPVLSDEHDLDMAFARTRQSGGLSDDLEGLHHGDNDDFPELDELPEYSQVEEDEMAPDMRFAEREETRWVG